MLIKKRSKCFIPWWLRLRTVLLTLEGGGASEQDVVPCMTALHPSALVGQFLERFSPIG